MEPGLGLRVLLFRICLTGGYYLDPQGMFNNGLFDLVLRVLGHYFACF